MSAEPQFRHELKYICSSGELRILESRLRGLMKPDSHAGADGIYHIRSIYFDDPDNSSFRENEDGVNGREKWRIRAYNCDPSRISLECKRKENDMILKKSCEITQEQFYGILEGRKEALMVSAEDPALLNRFRSLIMTRGYAPKCIVGYDRKPYICRVGNVRVTMDCNIFSSPDVDRFFSRDIRKRPIQLRGQHLLEVKYDALIPDYIFRTIQMKNMERTAFSKYYLCRKYTIG